MVSNSYPTVRLLTLFIGFTCLSLLTSYTNTMIIWFILIGILSIIFIKQNQKKIERQDIVIGIILSLLVMVSNVFIGFFILPSYLASMCILKDSSHNITLYSQGKGLQTFACIFICGGILAAINLFLASGQYAFHPSIKIMFLFHALQAGIYEEVCLRFFMFALCIKVTGQIQYNRYQNILVYCVMIIPHVLLHFSNGIDIMSFIILSLLFGLPFALMQRKCNLLSAIGAHSFVDVIRFLFLGI